MNEGQAMCKPQPPRSDSHMGLRIIAWGNKLDDGNWSIRMHDVVITV